VEAVDLLALTRPTAIDKIEWFASALDLCRAMNWLRQATEQGEAQEARAILSINPGLPTPKGAFSLVGFKGGSEGGVLNLTFLLRNVAGDWYTMAMTWNNQKAVLDRAKLYDLATQALFLLGAED